MKVDFYLKVSRGMASLGLSDNPTRIVDESGQAYVASQLRLANQQSAGNRQSYFQIFGLTKPKLTAIFENVGLSVKSATRVDLGIVHLAAYKKIPLTFRIVPIEGENAQLPVKAITEEVSEPRFLIESARALMEVLCTVNVTNLGDSQRNLYLASASQGGAVFNSLREPGVAKLIDEGGNAYTAESIRLNGKQGPASGQGTWTFQPYERSEVAFLFRNVPQTLMRITRFDVAAAHQEANGMRPIPARYSDVLLASQPQNTPYKAVSDKAAKTSK